MAKGRDGRTDIWGVIVKPTNFDPAKKYPVIENIYAGPQSSFVPKSFAAYNAMQAQAELGFIVVQIDGMGTSNRSKAFHDVAWKNLKDAGFPDRLLWHKAAAAKYPWYDISRVGLYGTSAGGQNALGGLLFFPDFYKVAVSAAGCHDNRMDKIWWNEQWMGWPIGREYAESSNVDNAYRLQGKVQLVVGEMDQNVDPASTFQVVNQLIKHNKDFELLVIPGARPRQRWRLRRAQALRFLHPSPARTDAAGVEGARGRDEESNAPDDGAAVTIAVREAGKLPRVSAGPDLTGLLQAWSRGDREALAVLAPLVQQELREMARRLLAAERRDGRWRPTELVQESYLRLLDWRNVHWQNRAHFFTTTARMMRRVLVDAARARRAVKRGEGIDAVRSMTSMLPAPVPAST